MYSGAAIRHTLIKWPSAKGFKFIAVSLSNIKLV